MTAAAPAVNGSGPRKALGYLMGSWITADNVDRVARRRARPSAKPATPHARPLYGALAACEQEGHGRAPSPTRAESNAGPLSRIGRASHRASSATRPGGGGRIALCLSWARPAPAILLPRGHRSAPPSISAIISPDRA